MQKARRHGWGEAAAATIEYVGVAVVAVLLLGGVATGMARSSEGTSAGIAARLGAALDGEPASRRWRGVRETRRSGGSAPVRVSRDELRMRPIVDPVSWREGTWSRSSTALGARGTVDATACVLCAGLEWSYDGGPRAQVGTRGSGSGLFGLVDLTGRVALASAQVNGRVARSLGDAPDAFAQGRLRGTLGAEVDIGAEARVGRHGGALDLEAGAMAGAVGRAEAKAGVDLLGISIRQSGAIEGWAGAGARGAVGVSHERGVTSWRVGWGAALGLGAAGEWSGSVDATDVPRRHRRLARDALLTAVRSAIFPVPVPVVRPDR